MLRKAIDYFAHLCVEPSFYDYIKENDTEFAASEYMQKLSWLKDDKETVYDPECDDILRVAFMHMYPRARRLLTRKSIFSLTVSVCSVEKIRIMCIRV